MDASYPVIVGFVGRFGRQAMNDDIFRRALSVAGAEIDFYAADARETLDPYQLGSCRASCARSRWRAMSSRCRRSFSAANVSGRQSFEASGPVICVLRSPDQSSRGTLAVPWQATCHSIPCNVKEKRNVKKKPMSKKSPAILSAGVAGPSIRPRKNAIAQRAAGQIVPLARNERHHGGVFADA
jgi:hypothetical protein